VYLQVPPLRREQKAEKVVFVKMGKSGSFVALAARTPKRLRRAKAPRSKRQLNEGRSASIPSPFDVHSSMFDLILPYPFSLILYPRRSRFDVQCSMCDFIPPYPLSIIPYPRTKCAFRLSERENRCIPSLGKTFTAGPG